MRPLQLTSVLILFAALAVGRAGAQAQQADPDADARARLLEMLRNAPPAPMPPGSQVGTLEESSSPARRRLIGVDLATGAESVAAVADAATQDVQSSSSPPRPPQYPTGPETTPPVPPGRGDGTPGMVTTEATRPSPLLNTLNPPWNTVFKLVMRFSVASGTYEYSCSAAAAGPFHLITAGHCIYNHDPDQDGSTSDASWATEVLAFAAQTDQVNPFEDPDHPYGMARATFLRSYTGWTGSQDLNHDWGIITLNRWVGDRTGWMGRETNTLASALNFSGYPGEPPYVPAGTLFQYPGFDAGNVRGYTTNRIALDAFIYGGHSGGPAWRFDGTGRWIQGVNSTSDRVGYAELTRLTNEKFADIDNVIAADGSARPPVARADLIEYLFSLSAKDLLTNVATPGGPVTIEYNVLNAGHATATNVQVDFRLSLDPFISAFDTPLGTVSLGSLAQNTFANSIATVAVPFNQPTGVYYVGWILRTSTTEYATDDNMVVIGNELLSVVTAPDLRTISPGASSSSLFTGENVLVSATVQNQGSAAAPATTLRYRVSTDSIITATDTQIGTDAVPALSPGLTSFQSEIVRGPSSPGSYWIGACVDTVVGEVVTTNQCSTGIAITVTAYFTDDPLTAGMPVKAIHFLEMRARVDTLRSVRGLPAAAWTDLPLMPLVTVIRAIHLQQIRAALADVYIADGLPPPVYTNPVAAGAPIRAIDVTETRAAIAARR
jgi:V8-like Glu-specific endopeptidase